MTKNGLKSLLAQKSQIEELIENLSPTEILDRASLEHRLSKVNVVISRTAVNQRIPARLKLTFRGKPVVGSHGMDADFASKTVGEFSNAVAAMSASRDGPVPSKGRIPGRSGKRFLITSTAIGSFGFELEEALENTESGSADSSPSDVEQAFDATQQILEGARTSNDDSLAELLANVSDRAITSIRSFLKILSESKATFAIDFNDKVTRYRDLSEIDQAFQRLEVEVKEDEAVLPGTLLGVLPVKRSFEFQLEDESIISGKVSPSFGDLEVIRDLQGTKSSFRFKSVRVGKGKPSYTLISAD
jgi:hypothetical protein